MAFCEGGDSVQLGRVWADGNTLDLSQVAYAFYNGSESQLPDAFMELVEGTGNVPAYRGTCYLVFYNLTLDDFGNRMPQITAEIVRTPPIADPNDLPNLLGGVALLPGAGEFVLGTTVVKSSDGFGNWFPENSHTPNGTTDFLVSLGQLEETLPTCRAVSLVVTWFGTDLRAGACQIVPKVETRSKVTTPYDWSVAGQTRDTAALVSTLDPATLDPTGLAGSAPPTGLVPAFGGTPSDQTRDRGHRGAEAAGHPRDVLPVRDDGRARRQRPAGPLRRRRAGGVSLARAHHLLSRAGQAGTVDKTAAAATQVERLLRPVQRDGDALRQPLRRGGRRRRFIIGSELVGLTQVRSSPGDGTYPAVQQLKSLAATVKGIVGSGCKVGYAADWTRIPFAPAQRRQRTTSSSTWTRCGPTRTSISSASTIICRCPIGATARPTSTSDPVAGPFTIYDKSYLSANIEGGEDYDWYYASAADRVSQTRTPIVDTAHAEHWVFRQKDIRSWWSQRASFAAGRGARRGAPTGYVPQGKPIWFTEFGCPAVDKGPNQPNVFYDPKSAESSLPYFSLGSKDDPVQRAYLETMLGLLARPRADLGGLRRPDAVDRQHVRLGLGRAAVSRFPRPHRRVARHAELRARPLAHRPRRRGAAQVDHRRAVRRRRRHGL